MLNFTRSALGAFSFVLVLLWLGFWSLPHILGIALLSRAVGPRRRLAWTSTWARVTCGAVFLLLRLGGARHARQGFIETDQPGIIVMNHQSVLDILAACLMTRPVVPAFIARERYAAAPIVGTAMRMADCPIIDPRADREGAVLTLRRAVRQDRAVLIFPEGHRTPDGELQPFRTAGLLAMLGERRVPVWLLATDGFSCTRKLIDFVLHVHRVRGRTEVVGRFDPPRDARELPAFLDRLHAELAGHLRQMRSQA